MTQLSYAVECLGDQLYAFSRTAVSNMVRLPHSEACYSHSSICLLSYKFGSKMLKPLCGVAILIFLFF
jgi:hypothetical protein